MKIKLFSKNSVLKIDDKVGVGKYVAFESKEGKSFRGRTFSRLLWPSSQMMHNIDKGVAIDFLVKSNSKLEKMKLGNVTCPHCKKEFDVFVKPFETKDDEDTFNELLKRINENYHRFLKQDLKDSELDKLLTEEVKILFKDNLNEKNLTEFLAECKKMGIDTTPFGIKEIEEKKEKKSES